MCLSVVGRTQANVPSGVIIASVAMLDVAVSTHARPKHMWLKCSSIWCALEHQALGMKGLYQATRAYLKSQVARSSDNIDIQAE